MIDTKLAKNTIFIFNAILFFTLFFCISGCDGSKNRRSAVDVNVNIKHFEKDLFELKANAGPDDFLKLREEYGPFYDDFVSYIMGYGDPLSDSAMRAMYYLSQDEHMKHLAGLVAEKYSGNTEAFDQIKDAYSIYYAQFPEDSVRDVVTYISGFSMTLNPVSEDYTGLSLDMFMGDTFTAYRVITPPIPDYLHKLFVPEQLAIQNMKSIVYEKVQMQNPPVSRILDEMISWGKLYYILEEVMPETEKHLLIGYDESEMEWCEDVETDIWKFFIKDQLMFQNMNAATMKLFTEGPRTSYPGVPIDYCAPMIARYSGWKLVKSYMENNSELSMQDLISETDSDKILKLAAYKP
jgi:hypothetical protein